MGAHDAAAAARAKMAQVQREMAERRSLRDRKAREGRAEALNSLRKQGPVMAQVAKHMGELGRRRAQAGGWATEKTEKDKDAVLSFANEDEQTADDPYAFLANVPRPPDDPPGGIGRLEEEESPLLAEPPPEDPPPTPAPPPRPPAAAVRRPAPEHSELDDEDDFSNQSSWLRNQ